MGCSLQKKLREKAEWICKHCGQVFDDFEEARKHESIAEGQEHHLHGFVNMLDVKFAITEVAQKIRHDINHLKDSQKTWKQNPNYAYLSGKIDGLERVLGLLVEDDYLECEKEDPTEEGDE